jgi:WD40 repeat protein
MDEKRASVAFSPDSQWLVTGEPDAFRFWKIGSWEPGPVLTREQTAHWIGPLAFSFDKGFNHRMLALTRSLQDIQLVDLGTLRELATLSATDMQPITWLCFSPDGMRLAALTENHTIQLWDLRVIRRELAAIGLDWDQPPYPPPEVSSGAVPLQVIVDLGELAKPLAKEPSR